MTHSRYLLITSAYNEAAFIAQTIESISKQDILPVQWIIVDDGSTDGTCDIVSHYQEKFPYISLRTGKKKNRHDFSHKSNALNSVLSNVDMSQYDYIGILDADITLPSAYYSKMMHIFADNPKLGVCGGVLKDRIQGRDIYRKSSKTSVSGGIQFFRKRCLLDIGMNIPVMRYGGEDTMSEIYARMQGWEVRSFFDITGTHHRLTGSTTGNIIVSHYKLGIRDYHLGASVLFEFGKCISRIAVFPVFIGAVARLCGFLYCRMRLKKRDIKPEALAFIRKLEGERVQFWKK